MTEPTIYNALQNNFTQVSNEALIDARLSGKAYKLYAYMCYRVSLSASWIFNKAEILKHFVEGESAMRGAFDELIKAGFLERIRVRNNKGIFVKTDFKIYSTPINKGSDPQVENPPVDNPPVGKPQVENQRLNKKDKINKDSSNKEFISSIEDTKKYFSENNFKSNPEHFFDFWESTDWIKGKNKIKNREAEARSWERNFKQKNPDLYKITLNSAISESTVALNNPDSEEIAKIRSTIKLTLGKNYDSLYKSFENIEKTENGFVVIGASKKTENYREILQKLNVELQINS